MILELYQVSAIPVEGDERLSGYYCFCRSRHYILPIENGMHDDRYHEWVEIDSTTIEPIKEKPIKRMQEQKYLEIYDYYCPNCNNKIFDTLNYKNYKYCPECGMGLDTISEK